MVNDIFELGRIRTELLSIHYSTPLLYRQTDYINL